MFEFVSSTKKQGSHPLGSIVCSVLFDSLALQLVDVEKGTGISAAACNWDRVDYTLSELVGNTTDPVKRLNLYAYADDPAITGTPTCLTLPDGAEIFRLKFSVSNDFKYNCEMLPIRFVWTGCQQNAAYSPTGDTVFLPTEVFDYSWDGNLNNQAHRLTGFDCDSSYNYSLGGECAKFLQDCAPLTEIRNLVLWNGGVDLVCADSIDDPWDTNRCPWDYMEMSWWERNLIVMLPYIQNYILVGDSALNGLFPHCISETDVNQDNTPLTVADLAFAIRIVVGDAIPITRLAPYHASVVFDFESGTVTSSAVDSLSAIALTFVADSTTTIANNSNLDMLTNYRDRRLHVLLYTGYNDMMKFINPGSHDLVTLTGAATLTTIQVSDYNGNLLLAR